MSQIYNTYFNIKTFSVIPYQDIQRCNYKLMVDGVWYNYTDAKNPLSEINIVLNFPLSYEVDENSLREQGHLLHALAKLSGEKSNITNIIPRLKEKGKLKRQLLVQYQYNLEELIVSNEKTNITKELERVKKELSDCTRNYNSAKISLKDINERINVLYKDIKDNMDNPTYESKLKSLKETQENLLNNEIECKIQLDMLKEDLAYYSKALKKPFTNIELDNQIKKDTTYRELNREIIEISNVLDYIEHLDKSQDEKSLIIRAIKGLFQNEGNNIKF